MQVAPVNDAPVMEPVATKTREDTSVDIALVVNDIDKDALTFQVVRAPTLGQVEVLPGPRARVRFQPSKDLHGDDVFELVANDGQARSAPVAISVAIAPVNDAPAVPSLRLSTPEDTPLTAPLQAKDVDGEPLRLTLVKKPMGTVTLDEAGVSLTYTPQKNFAGTDSFGYTATDPAGLSTFATVIVVVTDVEDAPTGYPASFNVSRYGSMTGRLQGHDPEGRPLRFRIVEGPTLGSVDITDPSTGAFRFDGKGAKVGRETFRFVVSDGLLDSAPVEVTVDIR